MPETTTQDGTFEWLDQLGDTAQKLAEIWEMLVKAGLIKGELPEVLIPYVPEEKPWWKSPYLPVAIGVGVVGGAGTYYVVKKRK